MDDVVGVRAMDAAGRSVAFMVWGRLFDVVDDRELLDLVRDRSSSFAGAPMTDFRISTSLLEISNHEYLFESFLWFARRPVPFGEEYQAWRAETRRKLIEDGEGLLFVGSSAG
jgi:hypothetical protein